MADPREMRVLVLVRGNHEGQLTQRLLGEAGIYAELCEDAEDLCHKLAAGAGAALLAEEVLNVEVLRQLERALAEQPAWSDFPILVFTAAAAPTESAQRGAAAALGNVTFLDRPVRVATMLASLRVALRSRGRQYEARRAIESRDKFLAMLGHELRNPLSAITFALLALDRKSNGSRPSEYGVLDRQVRHLSRLVDELLDVARVTHGKVVIERERLDLAEIAKGAFDALEPRAREQALTYRLTLEERPLWVLGDRQRLEQVVGNLLTNAIKYTPRGGTVSLHVYATDERARVTVADSGVGLAEEMQERIFSPFTQVDSSLDRSQGGLGLGLALVQSLVALHGGRVKANSEGLGKGSRFEVELPRVAAAEPSADSTIALAPPPSLLRVVLVEDNPDVRELFALLLKDSGHDVTAADDGPSGLSTLLSVSPDIAFVDVGLPGFDGYELARRARASGSRTRLVALTGYGQSDDRKRAAEAGFDEHLVKPVANDAILRALSRA